MPLTRQVCSSEHRFALHGEEEAAFGDAGYQDKRSDTAGPTWHVAMRPGKRKKLNLFIGPDFIAERVERKASGRASGCPLQRCNSHLD